MRDIQGAVNASHAGMVKVCKFFSQILHPQTTGKDEPQCRGTIHNVFEVQTKAFSKSNSHFLRKSVFAKISTCHTIIHICIYLRTIESGYQAHIVI